jgi:Tol biopolymer transport system component
VLDYTLSAAGSKIAYAVAREDQGSDMYLLDLISGEQRLVHSCTENVLCQSLALDPDEKLLAFEKLEFKVGAAGKPVLNPSQVWAIDMSEGAEAFPIGPDNHVTTSPMWSPEGWLAYYDSTLRAIALVDVVNRPNPTVFKYMSNDMGLMGSWSPDGTFLLLSDIVFPQVEYGEENEEVEGQASFYSHLYRVNANSGFVVDLTAGNIGTVEDASPSYSPDGEWIAYTRKYLEEDRWTLGRQLWLMRSDGSDAYQFSDEPFYGHSSLAWSPDSSAIAYMRKGQLDISQPAEIWLIEIDEGEPKQLVVGGYLPQWIP